MPTKPLGAYQPILSDVTERSWSIWLPNFFCGFYLTIGLRVVWRRFTVFNPIFLCQVFHQLGSELSALVGNNFTMDTEAGKYVFIDEFDNIFLCGPK
jgi:hypothetical protein